MKWLKKLFKRNTEDKPKQRVLGSFFNKIKGLKKLSDKKQKVKDKRKKLKTKRNIKKAFKKQWKKYNDYAKKAKELNEKIATNDRPTFNYPFAKKEDFYNNIKKIHDKKWEKEKGIFNEYEETYNQIDELYNIKDNDQEFLETIDEINEINNYSGIYDHIYY